MHFALNVSPLEEHIAYESHRIQLQRIIRLPCCVSVCAGLFASVSLHTLNDVCLHTNLRKTFIYSCWWVICICMQVLHACLCAWVFPSCEVTCVLLRGASDTSIVIENGRIREGPLFPRREAEMKVMQKSTAAIVVWLRTRFEPSWGAK